MKTQFNKIENSSVTSNLKAISPQFQFEISPTPMNLNRTEITKLKPLTIRFCLEIFFFCVLLHDVIQFFTIFVYILC